nr:hypothetical protein BaRGS_023852 [Batillaria attramentaria]
MTYEELLKAVTELASLIEQNLPETHESRKHCVSLHLPKSMAYVLSALTCVRVGCPFLPVPVDLPVDRMMFMLQDAGVMMMITSERKFLSNDFPEQLSNARLLFTSQSADQRIVMLQLRTSNNQPKSDETVLNGPSDVYPSHNESELRKESVSLVDDCCYVIYTSGSTGRPKGVQVKLPGVVNMCKAVIAGLNLQPTDTTAQFAAIGFDTSIWETFPTLLSGGSLAVLLEKERLGKEFVKAMADLEVNVITLTPSFLSHYSPADLPNLTKLCAAGETCTLHTALKWTSKGEDGSTQAVRFFNAYGPTETTVGATMYEFKREDYPESSNQELAIGTAMRGVDVYLLDEFMKPVPPGVVGEIVIGGAGVSGGYIGHAADQNVAKFIENPFKGQAEHATDKHSSLLYRSGDHAFQDKTGRLTFVGRLDNQIKIRGYRVDLGEIEQVLMRQEHVEIAVVVRHKCKTSSGPSLVAFVAPSSVCTSDLMDCLARLLPKFMLPNCILAMDVDNLPISTNGKIDRTALEADESVHDLQLNDHGGQLTDSRRTMAELWCRVFGLDDSVISSMSPLTSFSATGGSSLHLVRLQQYIEDAFHVTLPIDGMWAADTIEDFCTLISRAKGMPRGKSTAVEGSSDTERLRMTILKDSSLEFDVDNIFTHQKLMNGGGPVLTNATRSLTNDTIHASAAPPSRDPDRMTFLLTGVTGFLGAFFLHEVLEQTKARVVCLVRGKSSTHAMDRVVKSLTKFDLWNESYTPRLAAFVSDVSQERLGLVKEDYSTVCAQVDVIIINAARVNFNTSYYDHRQTNVLGTRELLKIAMTGKKMFVFHISSLSVFLFPSDPQDDGKTAPQLMKETVV